MPSSAVKKKLRLANNAWKGLTTLLRSKLFLLKRSKAFKRTATAISTVLGRRRRRRRRFRVKNLSLPRLPSDPAAGCNGTKIQRQRRRAVYVDDLFAGPASTPVGIEVAVLPAAFVGKVPADEAAAPPEAAAGGPVEAGASHIGSSPTVVVDNMVCWIGSNRCDSAESERIIKFPIHPILCESDQFSSDFYVNQFNSTESERIRKNLNRPIPSMRRNLVDNGSSLQLGLGKTSPGDLIGGREGKGEGSSSSSGIHQLEGVDLRAELFIAKFREEMRRQK